MKNADLPAMPTKHDSEHFQHSNTYTTGLTKREHFAGLAIQSLLNIHANTGEIDGRKLLRSAVEVADALLAALEVAE